MRDEQIAVLQNKESLQEERIQALFQLMNIADEESLNAIFETLRNDPCEIVRHEAAFVLGETAAPSAIEELKNAIDNDESEIVKHESLLAIGTINDPQVVPFLESKVSDENHLVSESAKVALQRINWKGTPYRGPKQFEYLKDKE